jgi:hypothetical protein
MSKAFAFSTVRGGGYTRKSFDIVAAFVDVLGKRVGDVPDNYERGEFLIDTAMDLETNATKGLARENSLLLKRGTVPESSTVKIAQTFRSGTNDIDALDFLEMFLKDEEPGGREACTLSVAASSPSYRQPFCENSPTCDRSPARPPASRHRQ